MKTTTLLALAFGSLLPLAAFAQSDAPAPGAEMAPPPEIAAPAAPEAQAQPAAAAEATANTGSALLPVRATISSSSKTAPANAPAPTKGEIRLNFQNASLADVLNYLSEAAGFIVLQDSPVAGTVNVVSKQPVTAEDAVDMLNSVLIDKGYAAIRNGRILKIVPRSGAQKQDIPVMTGSDPTQIPRKDGMVTQIIPVRYVDATKLVENLRPLLSADATLNANEASNALILADTQINVRRMAEIVRALDSSISSISTIHVYTLQYADAKSLATVLTQLFATDQSSAANNARNNAGGRNGPMPPWAAAMMGNNAGKSQSAAQQAATRIIAVADEQSNSVIVSAPDAAIPTITDIVTRIDTNISDVTEIRIFPLEHADATELANEFNSLYSDTGATTGSNNANRRNQQPQMPGNANNANRSERSILQTRVVAVADPRTNCLILSASKDSMPQLAQTIARLDSGEDKKQQVYVFRLENADPNNVATILRGMFSSQGSSSSSSAQPTSGRLNQRSNDGASSSITNLLNN